MGKCFSHISPVKKKNAPQAEVGEEQKKKDLVSSPRGDNTVYLDRVFIYMYFNCCWAILFAKILFPINLLVIQVLFYTISQLCTRNSLSFMFWDSFWFQHVPSEFGKPPGGLGI